MPYDNNVPQPQQTIAFTQPLINANFAFIQADAQVEHSFNGTPVGVAEGVHLRASMPNQADPVALPTGTNGMYYVNAGGPKYYNGTDAYIIQTTPLFQNILTGNITITANAGTTGTITFPANSVGTFYLEPPNTISPQTGSAMGQFVSNATVAQVSDLASPGITPSTPAALTCGFLGTGSTAGTYKFVLVYYTP